MSSRSYVVWLGLAAGLFVLTGCGTPGAPQPPSLRVPKPVDDLTATRKGNRVLLTWTPSTRTTDGENIRHAGTTQVCRGMNDFPMAQCDEKVATLDDAQVEHWTKGTMATRKDYVDTLPHAAKHETPLGYVTYALSDHNPNGRTAGLSNQVRVPLAPTLPPPADFRATVTAEGVELTWTGVLHEHEDPSLRHFYRIFRRSVTDPNKPEVIAGEVTLSTDPNAIFIDRTIEWEQQYAYRMDVITQFEQPGKESVEVEGEDTSTIEVLAHDVFPPATPTGLQAVFSGVGQKPFIDLTWAPDLERDLAGYNVYRHAPGAAPVKINRDVVQTPAFRDTDVEPGNQFFYAVSAVDQRGNESAKSEETSEKAPE